MGLLSYVIVFQKLIQFFLPELCCKRKIKVLSHGMKRQAEVCEVCVKCISLCSNVQILKIFKNILRIENTACA